MKKQQETTGSQTPGLRARWRARGMTDADGDINSFSVPLSDHARTRGKRRRPFTEAEIAAWRNLIFAETMDDPVKVAVEEAVKAFGSSDDFTIWAWYANRIGVNNFLELYFEQQSIMRSSTLRNPAAAFHMRLKRFYSARFPKTDTGRKETPTARKRASATATARLRTESRGGLPSVARSAQEGGAA